MKRFGDIKREIEATIPKLPAVYNLANIADDIAALKEYYRVFFEKLNKVEFQNIDNCFVIESFVEDDELFYNRIFGSESEAEEFIKTEQLSESYYVSQLKNHELRDSNGRCVQKFPCMSWGEYEFYAGVEYHDLVKPNDDDYYVVEV